MIDRDDWEDAVKDVRMQILSRTHDPEARRQVAAIIDATTDKLFEALALRDFIRLFH